MDPKHDQLEQQIHRLLRSLPERPAPSGLEAQVLARLAMPMPWWRRPYSAWPQPLRVLFFVASAAAAVAVVAIFRRLALPTAVVTAQGDAGRFANTAQALIAGLSSAGAALLRGIPPLWLYTGISLIAAGFAGLFGLGSILQRAIQPSLSK